MDHKSTGLQIDLDANRQDARTCTLRLSGYLDLYTCDALQEFLQRVLQEGWRDITLDLGKLDYISSMGVGLLMEAMSVAEERGGRLRFRNLSPKVRDVVEMLGIMLEMVEPQEAEPVARGPAVLVVDDDPETRSFMQVALEPLGCEVLQAEAGSQAIALLETRPDISLVIADWMMPDRDGIDLLREIRSRWPWIERILLTGVPQVTRALQAIERGVMSRIVTKPWDVAQMLRTVETLLRESGATGAESRAPR